VLEKQLTDVRCKWKHFIKHPNAALVTLELQDRVRETIPSGRTSGRFVKSEQGDR